ncbi:MAG: lipid asymmetry maintenance protein MlaB [Candidatus Malihini olakiniferum]
MAEVLHWMSQDSTLALSGDLDRDSLLADKHVLNISALERVNSAVLAACSCLLAEDHLSGTVLDHLCAREWVKTLIALYNFNEIIPVFLFFLFKFQCYRVKKPLFVFVKRDFLV